MLVRKAVALEIGGLDQPVVTLYQLALVIFRLYRSGSYRGEKLRQLKKTRANRSDCLRIIQELQEVGVLDQGSLVRHSEVFSILGNKKSNADEIVCTMDPFAYVSHLSAMEWHGLTDRIGRTLIYSSPPPPKWRQYAWEKMQKDIGETHIQDYLGQNLPRLKRLSIKRIGRVSIHRYLSEHLGAFTSVQGRCLRVSTIGRTFLEMLREPDLCGGISHVLDVFDQYGPRYLKLITDEVDRHGTKIDKVRAGYILDERMGMTEPRIDAWRELTQRGGSRKLYARNPYSSEYSERWCLSINAET